MLFRFLSYLCTMETPIAPPFTPAYNKPETPGIWMNFDNTVSIYHIINATEGFHQWAQDIFRVLCKAQERFPDWPRMLYLDITGQSADHEDLIEFQQEFWFSTIAPFLTGFDLPLTGPLLNPTRQRNELPDKLVISDP